jgi:hypothetical protein
VSGHRGTVFASAPGLGQVYVCDDCGNVHLQIGPVNLTLTPEAYLQFVVLLSESAANFEVWKSNQS